MGFCFFKNAPVFCPPLHSCNGWNAACFRPDAAPQSFNGPKENNIMNESIGHTNTVSSASAGNFSELDLCSELHKAIRDAGFTETRPIQAAALPAALEGKDILGLAETGTGKTAAFAIPILEFISQNPGQKRSGPRALVVAPTRELAKQIETEIQMLGKYTGVRTAAIFGGVSTHRQKTELRRNPGILVACPGRLLDLYEQGIVRLNEIDILVLDEADHMFDMGFLPDIRRILKAVPSQRQNLLFSATMPSQIRELADKILVNPHVVDLSHSKPAATIEHGIVQIGEKVKYDLLRSVLSRSDAYRAIVFTRTKHRARKIARNLEKNGHSAVALQGNMSQGQRDRAMAGFRSGDFDVLVATDIAARGIDVASVDVVINYDLPITVDAYTRRIGRTGRSECKGWALSFVTSSDRDTIRSIERRIGEKIAIRALDEFGTFETQEEETPEPQTKSFSRRPNRGSGGSFRGGKSSNSGNRSGQRRGRRGGR